ncbi:hypothetical protein FF38_11469 [Lucilia cuprina]|uniref:Uncharacterized protein n=1 Tax=Lucilia cuprina TaxID=7375 RepID=A0A0L0CR72_LUCCU|nr:hypothetical protein FF38_11469 [Lucilia cuprina]
MTISWMVNWLRFLCNTSSRCDLNTNSPKEWIAVKIKSIFRDNFGAVAHDNIVQVRLEETLFIPDLPHVPVNVSTPPSDLRGSESSQKLTPRQTQALETLGDIPLTETHVRYDAAFTAEAVTQALETLVDISLTETHVRYDAAFIAERMKRIPD